MTPAINLSSTTLLRDNSSTPMTTSWTKTCVRDPRLTSTTMVVSTFINIKIIKMKKISLRFRLVTKCLFNHQPPKTPTLHAEFSASQNAMATHTQSRSPMGISTNTDIGNSLTMIRLATAFPTAKTKPSRHGSYTTAKQPFSSQQWINRNTAFFSNPQTNGYSNQAKAPHPKSLNL